MGMVRGRVGGGIFAIAVVFGAGAVIYVFVSRDLQLSPTVWSIMP